MQVSDGTFLRPVIINTMFCSGSVTNKLKECMSMAQCTHRKPSFFMKHYDYKVCWKLIWVTD
jgi:hypothetical protein